MKAIRVMDVPVQACRERGQVNPPFQSREAIERPKGRKLAVIILPRKASMEVSHLSVPQTDTGRRGEYPKALELTLVKELGKMAP